MATKGRTRVCFCIPNMNGGGAERMAMAVAAALDRERYVVTLLVQERFGRLVDEVPDGLHVRYVNQGPYKRWHLIASLFATVGEALRHDVLVGANEGRATLIAFLAAKITRRPILGWIHVGWSEFAQTVSWRQRAALRLYASFDRIVACSRGAASDLAALIPATVGNTIVIYNGVDLSHVDRARSLPISEGHQALFAKPAIVTVGRLAFQKNQAALIEAHARVRGRGIDCSLLILGEGPDLADLKRAADSFGVADSVHFLGFHENPQRYMSRASVFALSSRFEGFSLVLLEAMRSGAPVVSFDCPHGPREVIGEKAGVLVPLGDVGALSSALASILVDPSLSATLRAAGLQRSEALGLENIAAEWGRVIDLAAARRAPLSIRLSGTAATAAR